MVNEFKDNQDLIVNKLLGSISHLKDFYFFMIRSGIKPISSKRYCVALNSLFIAHTSLNDKLIAMNWEESKNLIVTYIKNRKIYVTRYAIVQYMKFLADKFKNENYNNFSQILAKELRGLEFQAKRDKIVINKQQVDNLLSYVSAYSISASNIKRKVTQRICSDALILLRILYETGVRIDALLKMRISNVSFEGERAYLYMIEKRGTRIKMPVSISTSIYLRSHIAGKEQSESLIRSSYISLYKLLNSVCHKNSIADKFSFHGIRRARAKAIYEATGHDINKVSKYLHHKNINTTQTYIDALGIDFEKLVDEVNW